MANKFKPGDRCRLIRDDSGIEKGMTGTVSAVNGVMHVPFKPDVLSGRELHQYNDGSFAVDEEDLELITTPQHQPITPKVGEKYRVLKTPSSFHAIKVGGVYTLEQEYNLSYDRLCWRAREIEFWFDAAYKMLTTEYLELVSGPAQETVTIQGIKCSIRPASEAFSEPINQSIIKKTMNLIKKALLSKDDKNLIKAGYMDDNMNLTGRGREALEFITYTENKAKLVEMAEAQIAEDKEDKE